MKPVRGDIVLFSWYDPETDAGWHEKEYQDSDYCQAGLVIQIGIVWHWDPSGWIELVSGVQPQHPPHRTDRMIFRAAYVERCKIIGTINDIPGLDSW